MYLKGNEVKTIEDEDHLLYAYLPEYQRKKWFEVKDRSRKETSKTIEARPQRRIVKNVSLKRKKNKYMFAYL